MALSPVRFRFSVVVAVSVIAMLLAVPSSAIGAVPGDEPGTAIAASIGTAQYDSTSMTESAADPTACPDPVFPGPFSNTIWFSYRPARDALTVIDVNSFVSDGTTDYLAIVFVFAQSAGGLDLVACSAFDATVFIPAEAGTTYLVMVGGLSSTAIPDEDPALLDRGGTFELTIAPVRGRVLIDRFVNADTYVDDFLTEECGTEITVSFRDRVTVKTFFTATGPRQFVAHDVGWITFSGGGVTLRDAFAQTFRDTFDGSTQIVGLANRLSIGGGTILVDAGKIVFGPDGSVTFEAGPHPTFDEGFDICGALGL